MLGVDWLSWLHNPVSLTAAALYIFSAVSPLLDTSRHAPGTTHQPWRRRPDSYQQPDTCFHLSDVCFVWSKSMTFHLCINCCVSAGADSFKCFGVSISPLRNNFSPLCLVSKILFSNLSLWAYWPITNYIKLMPFKSRNHGHYYYYMKQRTQLNKQQQSLHQQDVNSTANSKYFPWVSWDNFCMRMRIVWTFPWVPHTSGPHRSAVRVLLLHASIIASQWHL